MENKSNHYVDNKVLYQELVKYKKLLKQTKKNNQSSPKIPDYIGHCWLQIATRLASKPNFSGYIFKEEMIADALENCSMYIDSFNSDKYKNPFAYFTQVIYYAFLRRITKEKKQLYIKQKVMEHTITLEQMDQYLLETVDLNNEKMQNIVKQVDKKRENQKKVRSKKVKTK